MNGDVIGGVALMAAVCFVAMMSVLLGIAIMERKRRRRKHHARNKTV